MACYKRIYYVDYFEKDKKQENAGFVKLVQWKNGGGTCFQMYISNLAVAETMECQIKLLCGIREIVLGQVKLDSGKGMAQIEDLDQVLLQLEAEGHLEKVELQMAVNEHCDYRCVIKEGVNDFEKNVAIEAAEVAQVTQIVSVPEVRELEEQEPDVSQPSPSEWDPSPGIRHVKSDKWQQLWEVLPHIRPFEDEREYLQVELQDMIVLSRLFYQLVENSFLLHGYYNYGHLILTKIYKKGKERIYIGVPGNYYVREAQVAVMFGFESFEPKEEPAREGDFGYYMIGVDI